jgi:hypothetical protein
MKRLPRPDLLVVLLLLAAAVGVVLALPAGLVFGSEFGDLPTQFIPWRAFAAASLRAGHLPLWNPYTYSGEPFLGGFQSALLYPPNIIFLGLSLSRAINLSILVHLVILAWGMYRWSRQRGLHPVAGVLCAGLLPLCGAVYPHVYAGHLSNICTMAWAPWILAGLEAWWTERRGAGLFQASAAICLQILAGHVQYVFLTGVAAGLDAVVWSAGERAARWRALPSVAACYAGAALLAAAQLFPGVAALQESARNGLPYTAASIFSFPFENFLTLFAPGFFGDHLHTPYWGRWYIQEMSIFLGAAGAILLLAGACDTVQRRRARLDLTACALLLLLALGANTPLYHPLYEFVPGFGTIRGMSKFTFPAMIFLVLAVGAGADALVRRRPVGRGIAYCAFAASFVLAAGGLWFLSQPEQVGDYIRAWVALRQDYLPQAVLAQAGFVHDAGIRAAWSLLGAGGLFLLTGGSLLGLGRWPWLRWAPLLLLAGEMVAFAWTNSATSDVAIATPDGVREFFAKNPGDYRVLMQILPSGYNGGYLLGAPDLWGNDPFVLRRYAEFMAFTRGIDPNQAGQTLAPFEGVSSLYTMLRCRYFFKILADGHIGAYVAPAPPMARAQLISDYHVAGGRDAIFAAMRSPDFNPRLTVLLESEPSPRPVPSVYAGTVHLVETSPDSLVIDADVKTPSLLLITDPYSRDWRAVALADSSQQAYTIQPANYILRAVPLAAGYHHLIMEYAPPSFRLGVIVSALAWLGWLAGALAFRRRRPASVL